MKPTYRHGEGEETGWEHVSLYEYPYAKTYDFPNAWIDADHLRFALAPYVRNLLQWHLEGWLMKGDALKLYELAYFAGGPILEVGAGWGLGTAILSIAARNARNPVPVETIEADKERADRVAGTMASWGLPARVRHGRSGDILPTIPDHSASFIFVDAGHCYDDCAADCRQALRIIAPGGFVLCHDFAARDNADPEKRHFKVYPAVKDVLAGTMEFWGCFGICGLFRCPG